MEIDEILTKKRRGDYDLIAEMTGCKAKTVKSQLLGLRKLTDKVKDAAEKLIQSREELMSQNN